MFHLSSNPSHLYDKVGNRDGNTVDVDGTTGYTANAVNAYTAIGSASPTYDDDGNLTADGTWSSTWDAENRLINADDGSADIDYKYDYRGRLVARDDQTDTTVYIYDGWNRIGKFVNGSHDTAYLWGQDLSGSMQGAGGVGGLLKEGSLYPLYDANGNIMQKIDSTGTTAMEVDYDPFGNIISGSLTGDYGFSTKPLDADTDLYYYGYRWYSQLLGRWLSRDPIGELGGLNLHTFVSNDPVSLIDVLGLTDVSDYFEFVNAVQRARDACSCCPEVAAHLRSILEGLVPDDKKLKEALDEMKEWADSIGENSEVIGDSFDTAEFLHDSFGVPLPDYNKVDKVSEFNDKVNKVSGKVSKFLNLGSAATSGDAMELAYTVGETFAPPGADELIGFYHDAYTAAKEAIDDIKFGGFATNSIDLVTDSCRAKDCATASATLNAAPGVPKSR